MGTRMSTREFPTTNAGATVDSYRTFIWELAKNFTNSNEEARAAVVEMHADIERCSEMAEQPPSNEDRLIARIAWRRLVKYLQEH
jgi:hypothetical protein